MAKIKYTKEELRNMTDDEAYEYSLSVALGTNIKPKRVTGIGYGLRVVRVPIKKPTKNTSNQKFNLKQSCFIIYIRKPTPPLLK